VKHQRFVGTGYFDSVQQAITSGTSSTTALAGSTETAQFHERNQDKQVTTSNGHEAHAQAATAR
jgi:hypothetical protein